MLLQRYSIAAISFENKNRNHSLQYKKEKLNFVLYLTRFSKRRPQKTDLYSPFWRDSALQKTLSTWTLCKHAVTDFR